MHHPGTATSIGLVILLLWSYAASVDTLTGKVVKVVDGDTLYANYEQQKIGLAGIDMP